MTRKMKNSNFGISMMTGLLITLMSACGESSSDDAPEGDVDTSLSSNVATTQTGDSRLLANASTNQENEISIASPNFISQVAAPNISVVNDYGSLILAESGLSLYVYDNDSAGVSTCLGTVDDSNACAGQWPPLFADDNAVATGEFTLITRPSGEKQWAYQNKPLYHGLDDVAMGDVFEDSINGEWHLARPQPLKTVTVDDVTHYVGQHTILTYREVGDDIEYYRVDNDGMSLYTHHWDPIDGFRCLDSCLDYRKPLLAEPGAAAVPPLSILHSSDGYSQWALNGKPLYFFQLEYSSYSSMTLARDLPAVDRLTTQSTILSANGRVNILKPSAQDSSVMSVVEIDYDGHSLYVFDNDSNEVSTCMLSCLENWPAFVPQEHDKAVGDFTIFMRSDGVKQWAYKGQPLYFYKMDELPGHHRGEGLQGINGVWHLASIEEFTGITFDYFSDDLPLGEHLIIFGHSYMSVRDPNTNDFVRQLVDKEFYSLYTFDDDSENMSVCVDSCLDTWPALLASKVDRARAPFTIFTRSDGLKQWAVNGKPLYFYAGDHDSGDINGEGLQSKWYVARSAPVRAEPHSSEGLLLVAGKNVLPSQGKTAEELLGLTLYTFDQDTAFSEESTCFGGCAQTWPPLYASATDQAFGEFRVIIRDESGGETYQWTYQGKPLYFFGGDSNVGDTKGNYSGWPIARP